MMTALEHPQSCSSVLCSWEGRLAHVLHYRVHAGCDRKVSEYTLGNGYTECREVYFTLKGVPLIYDEFGVSRMARIKNEGQLRLSSSEIK